MGYVIVLAIAVAVGVLVYRLTDAGEIATEAANPGSAEPVASPDDVDQWVGGEAAEPMGTRPGPDRIRVSPEIDIPVVNAKRSWTSRVNGGLGLVVAIAMGALAIALFLYGVGTLIARLVSAGVDAGGAVTP